MTSLSTPDMVWPEQWWSIPATLKTFLQGCPEERKDQELIMLNISSVSGTIHGWGNEVTSQSTERRQN